MPSTEGEAHRELEDDNEGDEFEELIDSTFDSIKHVVEKSINQW